MSLIRSHELEAPALAEAAPLRSRMKKSHSQLLIFAIDFVSDIANGVAMFPALLILWGLISTTRLQAE